MDEHFFEQTETLVAKKNRAIILSGLLPVVVKLDEVKDARAAFHRELYWIHKLAAEGHPLKNREAQGWFLRRYEEAFGRRETALRETPQGRGRPDGTAAAQGRHGEAWTGDEDRALMAKHAAGMSPGDIAVHADHRRSERAISSAWPGCKGDKREPPGRAGLCLRPRGERAPCAKLIEGE